MATAAVASSPDQRVPWTWRVREKVSTYLPLLLMLFLALGTWWLVKNTPKPPEAAEARALKHEPDYTMHHFAVQRYAPDGRLRARIEGEQLRHYPDTDTLEIDTVHIRAFGADGRVTVATARRALTNGDASEVQLQGGAHVVSEASGEQPVEFDGEFLDVFLKTEQVRSQLPVELRQGRTDVHAQSMDYDNLSRVVQLHGRVQAVLAPAPARAPARQRASH